MSYELCAECKKPLVNRENLIIFRKKVLIGVGLTGIFGFCGGYALLPLLGFTTSGVAARSIAAGMQSSIGVVAAGSTFAILQSLGATGLGSLLFGAIGGVAGGGGALLIMQTIAGPLGWCTCNE